MNAAPRRHILVRQTRVELRNTLRNSEQLLLLIGTPVAVLALGASTNLVENVGASALAAALTATCFTSVAITTGFERRYGVLRGYATTPLTTTDLVAAKALSAVVVGILQWCALCAAGVVSGTTVGPASLIALPMAAAALVPWALFLAMTLSAERVLALANLLFLALVLAGLRNLPLLPTSALRSLGAGFDLAAVATCALWSVTGIALTRRFARWSE